MVGLGAPGVSLDRAVKVASAAAAVAGVIVLARARAWLRRRERELRDEADSLITFALRALCDSPCDAGRYGGQGNVVAFAMTQADDNRPSAAAGMAGVHAAHPGVRTLVFDFPNEKTEQIQANVSEPKGLCKLYDDVGVAPYEMLPYALTYANTLTEAETLVAACRASRARALIIVAPPFHLPRSLLTVLSVAAREYPELHVYAHAGSRTAGWWSEEAIHSQGVVRGVRADLVAGETDRIRRYGAQGDLLSPGEALRMLAERDGRPPSTRGD